MPVPMLVLGLESSCDETAAALVDGERRIRADTIIDQGADHAAFGGIVPEIAARAHLDRLDGAIRAAFAASGCDLPAIDAVAATCGPGLIGGVIVGATMGKAIALALGKPFLAVNHLEGHALSARLIAPVDFPYLLLLVSGGHCQTLLVEGVGRYRRLGTTLDDAAGEAFDKGAKLLGLGYPGGPAIAAAAARARHPIRDLPRPMLGRAEPHFSFSGLKTALRQRVTAAKEGGPLDPAVIDDLAAGLETAIIDCLVDRMARALALVRESGMALRDLVVAGGVGANLALRSRLADFAAAAGLRLTIPPGKLCTDNAAMIAWAGIERLRLGLVSGLDAPVRPRWPLDDRAPSALGAGVKA